MNSNYDSRRNPSITTLFAGFMFLTTTLVLVSTYLIVSGQLRSDLDEQWTHSVQQRAKGLQVALGQALKREWDGIENAAEAIHFGSQQDLQQRLNALTGKNRAIAWAGFAGSDGIVRTASDGRLVGVDVSSRLWFQRGLQEPYAGDVHEAVLLASSLPKPPNGEPLRFLDFARPVIARNGQVLGVLGAHIDFAWAKQRVLELAKALEMDVFIVNSDGEPVITSTADAKISSSMSAVQAARIGSSFAGLETWANGGVFFTASLPEQHVDGLPTFGWSVIGRVDPLTLGKDTQMMSRKLMTFLAILAAIVCGSAWLFIAIFLRPFSWLADQAVSIADGDDTYPRESTRSRELSRMSSALVRLQAQRRE